MASVLDDATSRLYAGALLGKSIIKNLGEEGAEGGQRTTAMRRATLQAGVASGKINPSQLSKGDAGLLGAALEGKQKIPSGPFGFVGGLVKNFGSDIGTAFKGIPGGLIATGKALGEEAEKTVLGDKGNNKAPFMEELGNIGKSVVHDFSSPQQIYEHPFNPVVDVAGLFTGGAGLAAKGAGALSRAGKFAEGSVAAGAANRLINLTSTAGRAPAIASPGFTASRADELAKAGISPAKIPRAYAPHIGMKYVVQKPLDTLISRLGGVKIPGGENTLQDLQGAYYGRKAIINPTRAKGQAGTTEAFNNSPAKDMLRAASRMYNHGQGSGVYQSSATWFHAAGINTVEKLDEYAQKLREGQDLDGPLLTKEELAHAGDLIKRIEDPRFRQLIEHPTSEMKDYAHQIRRVNVHNAVHLDIDPLTSEDAAFGRLRAITTKTNDELAAELPDALKPQNQLAKGLQALQDFIRGEATAETKPNLNVLAASVPGIKPDIMREILERSMESLKQDVANDESLLSRQSDPNYVPGNNLYEKVAVELERRGGLNREQAQAFARGITLGTPEGPILPTYMPSVSGEGMNYGLRKDPLYQRIGRVAGVSRYRSLDGIERQPEFYEFKRPFSPRTASAQTIGLNPARNYLKEANFDSFLHGVMQTSPESIAHNAYQIQRDLIVGKLNPKMIDRLALKDADGNVKMFRGDGEMRQALGLQANHYVLVPVDTYKNYISTKAGLEMDLAHLLKDKGADADIEAEIEGLADESAQQLVSGESAKAATGKYQGVALPRTFVKTIVEHVNVSESGGPLRNVNAFLLGRWKSAVLSMMPSWLLRTSLGHGIIALIDGTVNPKFWVMAHRYFEDRPILPEHLETLAPWKTAGDALLGTKGRDRVEAGFSQPAELPPGVNQGGMMHELSDIGQGAREAKQLAPTRFISGGVHTTTNWQRRAIFLRSLDREAKQRLAELGRDFEHPGGFWDIRNIDAVLDSAFQKEVLKSPDLIEHAFDQLGKVSYTFGEMSPWERRIIKNFFPFYGWYKFISKFVWTMPINYPGRTAAIAALGNLGHEETAKMGILPDYLEGAIWFNHNDLIHSKYLNLYGMNPLENFANPFSKKGPLEGVAAAGQLSPMIQSLIAASGINPMTMSTEGIDPNSGIEQGKYGEWIDTRTGQIIPNIGAVNPIQRGLGTFLRAFPEIRALELARTGGNPVYPESIPGIDEHPIGVNPETRRGFTPLSMIEQEFGVQPRTYNIAKHTSQMLKAIAEAKKKNIKAQQRQTQKLRAPNP